MVDASTLERGQVDAPRAAMDQRDLVERAGRPPITPVWSERGVETWQRKAP